MVKSKIGRKVLPALAVILGFTLWGGYGAHAETPHASLTEGTGEESGGPKSEAVIVHEPRHFIFDGNASGYMISVEGTDQVYADWDKLPMLFPGDTVTIIPKLPDISEADHNGQTITGWGGVLFNDNSVADKYPLKITKTAAYGNLPSDGSHGNLFIQGFEIEGTEPVRVFSNGGGGYTSEPVNCEYANVSFAYYKDTLRFEYFPRYCSLYYQYKNKDDGAGAGLDFNEDFLNEELYYFTEEEEMDAIWGTDAVHNFDLKFKGDDLVTYTVRHPYIEGYYVYRVITSDHDSHAYQIQSNTMFDDETDTLTITPGWSVQNGTGGTYVGDYMLAGNYADDWTQVRFEFLACRTLTLDAMGGTVAGYPKRIYKASNGEKNKLQKLWEDKALIPERDGYLFLGWYEDVKYATPVEDLWTTIDKYSNSNQSPREDRTCRIFAKWLKLGWNELEDGSKVYYDEDGHLHTDWLTDEDGRQYFFNEDGIMQTGLQTIDGTTYYFDEDGAMQTGWQTIDGTKYYFKEDGAMQTGWLTLDKKSYYFTKAGAMVKGWKKISKKWYYLDPKTGVMATGWKEIKKDWYYFDKGVMVDGWKQISKKWYFFKEGIMQTGWVQSGKLWYYLDPKSGAQVTGWKQIGKGKWYYFNPKKDGAMSSGWTQIGKKWYYFDPKKDCILTTGWKKLGGKWYYFDKTDGYMVTGSRKIGSTTYHFNSNGICLNP